MFYFTCNESKISESFTFWNKLQEKLFHDILIYWDAPVCNVRLTLDITSDRRCILVENENRVDVNIWRQFDVDLTLDFGYTT